jgi:pimeloyl-ACP methyl ester carboxylesterase
MKAITAVLALATLAGASTTHARSTTMSGHIVANGIDYHYEIHGQGEPLVLLHGGLMNSDLWGPTLPALAAHHKVIAIDLQGHGRTPLGDRPIRLPAIADDLEVVLDKLGVGAVDVMGYSFGGGVAFRLAVQHPARVRRLVIVSACPWQDAFYTEMLPQQAALGAAAVEMVKQTPMYTSYVKIAPHPEEFPRLLDAMGDWMRQPFDWRADVAKVKAQTLLVFGDSDMFQLDKVIELYKLFGGGQRDAGWTREHMAKNRLAILPDVTHYEMGVSPKLVEAVEAFLR